MKRKNNKGIGLVELLIVIAVGAMTAPLLFWVFSYGIQSYSSYNKYIEQHYKVVDVTQRIRMDIEGAAAFFVDYYVPDNTVDSGYSVLALWMPDDDGNADTFSVRIWRIKESRLEFKSLTGSIDEGKAAACDDSGYSEVLGGLDTAIAVDVMGHKYIPTRFEWNATGRIILSIKPVNENTAVSKNRNVTKPVITEFSARYKDKIV